MSSFVGHFLVGASCLVLARPKSFQQAMPLVLVAGLLGLSPDVDYLLLWTAGWRPDPRITHSLVFVSVAAWSAWAFVRVIFADKANSKLLLIFFAAAASHLVLDALVGVTKNPTGWPFITGVYSSSIGFLPSAGKPDLFNVYFWRNLAIELGIIVPMLLFAYSLVREGKKAWMSWCGLVGLAVFVTSFWISLCLSR